MYKTAHRRLIVLGACVVFSGQCGRVHMSDQFKDYPIDTCHPQLAAYQAIFVMGLASIAPAVNSAIDSRRLDEATGKKWYQRKTTPDYLRLALAHENPDLRRFAVVRIAGGADLATDQVLEGLGRIARRDGNSAVRWVATRGLHRAYDPRSVDIALDILNCGQGTDNLGPSDSLVRWGCLLLLVDVALDVVNFAHGTDNVRPPDPRVRWGCLQLLDDYCARGLVAGGQRNATRDVMIRHLSMPCQQEVRYAAAMGLRHFKDEASRIALTDATGDYHLGVAQRAGQSLEAVADAGHAGRNVRLPR